MAIEGKCRNLFGDKLLGDLSLVVIQATISGGVATRDADNSSPNTTIAQDTTADYDITFPAGSFVHWVGGGIDNASDTPADTVAKIVNPRSLNASAGTGKILFSAADDGDEVEPATGARVYITLLVGN